MPIPLIPLAILAATGALGFGGTKVAETKAKSALDNENRALDELMRTPSVDTARAQAQASASDQLQGAGLVSGGGGGGAVRQGPSSAQVNPLLQALSSTDTVRDNALGTAQRTFDENMKAYTAENAQDRANYEKQVGQNESNLSANRQAALLQAAQGGQGLRSVLASLGALSGTGGFLADRAISQAANKDIGAADETFKTSADTLNTAWMDTERKQRQRNADAEAALANEQNEARRSYAQSRQGILSQLSNLYGGDTAQGRQYASDAAALYPTIAQNTSKAVAGYQASSPLYSQQALDTYKAGVNDLTVGAQAGGAEGTNPSLFALQQRRRDEELA